MKKIWIIFLSLFAVLAIASCNGENVEYDLSQQLEMPSNLAINESTKELSWDSVENASKYNIYLNGKLEADVQTRTFDFSKIDGSKLVFTVKAIGPKGTNNSQPSATIAYVSNKSQEVTKLKVKILENQMMPVNIDAFANELVSKGMLAEDFDLMMTKFETLTSLNFSSDMTQIHAEIRAVFDGMDMTMVEALISSLIKVQLKSSLQISVDAYDALSPSGQERSEDKELIEVLRNLLTFIDEKGDQAVKSAMVVIDYLMMVEESINTQLMGNIDDLMEAEKITSTNVNILITVKNDLVQNLKNNLPELNEVILLNSTLMAFKGIYLENGTDLTSVNIPRQSAHTLISTELLFNLILDIDADYMLAYFDSVDSYNQDVQSLFMIENLDLFNSFLKDNKAKIKQMADLYEDTEKGKVFFDMIVSMVNILDRENYLGELAAVFEAEINAPVRPNDKFNHGKAIILANVYADFYSTNKEALEDHIDEIATMISDPEILDMLDITSEDIVQFKVDLKLKLELIDTKAQVVKDYDYNNLTNVQKAEIEIFLASITQS